MAVLLLVHIYIVYYIYHVMSPKFTVQTRWNSSQIHRRGSMAGCTMLYVGRRRVISLTPFDSGPPVVALHGWSPCILSCPVHCTGMVLTSYTIDKYILLRPHNGSPGYAAHLLPNSSSHSAYFEMCSCETEGLVFSMDSKKSRSDIWSCFMTIMCWE